MVSLVTPRHEWQPTFLDVLRKSGNVSAAAPAACIARQEVYGRRQRYQGIAEACDEMVAEAVAASSQYAVCCGLMFPFYVSGVSDSVPQL